MNVKYSSRLMASIPVNFVVASLLALAGGPIPAARAQTYTWTGAVNSTWDTTSANWSGAGSTWVNGAGSDAVFGTGIFNINLGTNITANSMSFTLPNESGTLISANGFGLTLAGSGSEINTPTEPGAIIDAPIGGTVGLTKSGTATLRLLDPCNFTGATSIGAGSLQLAGGNNRLPVATPVSVSNGATFSLMGITQQIGALNGSGTVTGSPETVTDPSDLNISSNDDATFTGTIANGVVGVLGILKNGSGNQVFGGSSPNTYSDGTAVGGGTLIAAKSSAFGTGPVSAGPSATLGLNGGITLPNDITILGSGEAGTSGALDSLSGTNTLTGITRVGGGAGTIGATSGTLILTEVRSTTGSTTITFNPQASCTIQAPLRLTGTIALLVKNGDGAVGISEPNGVFGETTINRGTLFFNNNLALRFSMVKMTAGQSNLLRMNGFSPTVTGISEGGGVSFVDNAGSATASNLTLEVGSPAVLTFGGTIWDGPSSVGLGITKTSTGTQIFSGSNSYTGGTTVNGGTLSRTLASGFPGNTPYVVNGGTLSLGNFPLTMSSLSGSGGTVALGSFNVTINQFVNTSYAGVISGGTGLAKFGTGTLTLSGANTYTGLTSVNQGTLLVNGSIAGAAEVAASGTLGGNGSIAGTVTVLQNGSIAPGVSPGELTCSNGVSLDGALLVEISGAAPGTEYDQLQVTGGNVSLGAQSSINSGSLSGSFSATDRLYLIDNSGPGSTIGTFNGLPNHSEVPALAGLGGHPHWYIYYDANSASSDLLGGNDIAVSPVSPSLIGGSFETGPGSLGTLPIGSTAINNWKVTRGSVDWFNGWQAADGSRSVDLQGLNASGGVLQFVATVPGQRYVLAFKLSGNPDGGNPIKTMRARAGAVEYDASFNTTDRSYGDMGWQEHWMFFTAAAGTTEIELYSTDPADSFGAVVDDVRLVAVTSLNDANCDAAVTIADVDPFVTALVDLTAYHAAYPNCYGLDANCDGSVNALDIEPFTKCLTQGTCQCP